MKSLYKVGIAILAIILLASCGGPNKIEPESIKISGDLGDYLKIVDGEYEISEDGILSLRIKATNPCYCWGNEVPVLSIAFVDDKGTPVSSAIEFKTTSEGKDKLKSLMEGGKGEAVISFEHNPNELFILGDYSKVKKFIVSSKMEQPDEESESSNYSEGSNTENISEESTNSEDWDAVLQSYEDYIDQYVKFLKKAKNGDMSAMSEYTDMMDKATDLSEKLQNASENLTSEQMVRFTRLQEKLVKAAADM